MPFIKNNAIDKLHTIYETKLVKSGMTMCKAKLLIKERAELHERLYEGEDTLITFKNDSADHRRLTEINMLIFGENY